MARNVVISGGGTGIGLAAAQTFAAEGDRVLLLGRRAEVLEKAGVPGALTYAADLGDVDAVRGVVGFVEREFGTVDVLIHSAGGTGQLEPPVESADPLDAVAHDWTVNFRLNLLTAALLAEGLKEPARLAGRAGAVREFHRRVPGLGEQRPSRRPRRGCIRTPMISPASSGQRDHRERGGAGGIEDTEFFGAAMDPARRERLQWVTSTGRAGTPDDVAATLRWLASPGAGREHHRGAGERWLSGGH